jgi:hypothetical protein
MASTEHITGSYFSGSYRSLDCVVEYKREKLLGTASEHNERNLYRYGVFVEGKRLGHVDAIQSESRNRRSRHLLVAGYPIRWLCSTQSHRIKFSTRRQATIQLLIDKLYPRRKA